MSESAESFAPAPWRFFATHRGAGLPFFIDRGTSSRPSFAGSRPRETLVVSAQGDARVWRDGRWRHQSGDPIERISDFVERSHARACELPRWLGGQALPRTVGFLCYELAAWADGPRCLAAALAAPSAAHRSAGTPMAVLSSYDEVDAWNPLEACTSRIRFDVATASTKTAKLAAPDVSQWHSTTRESYRSSFERIRAAIAAGDIYQANLSRRAVFELAEDPAATYARLRQLQPVPWGAFLDFGGFALLSNSPECFLRRRGAAVCTEPIKGTRPRMRDAQRDAQQRAELKNDAKEMAEHLMIVDLERSDLGRVAATGTVAVPRLAEVESFATLHHLVSEVTATLRGGVDLAPLLRATFPGGSITGAPKLRAMEILHEVEAVERGPYTGAIGFFNGPEELELSIAIRTAIASGGRALYSTGGGIVADSDPEREWEETETKLSAFRAAVEQPTTETALPERRARGRRPFSRTTAIQRRSAEAGT